MSKRFDCCTPRPKKDGTVWWHKVGSAWQNDKGNITVYLDSVPVPDGRNDNKVIIHLFEQEERQKEEPPKVEGSEQMKAHLKDEIPF